MKIALVTQDEINEVWSILHPQDRFSVEAYNGVSIRLTDTLLLVGAEVVNYGAVREEVLAAYAEIARRRNLRITESKA